MLLIGKSINILENLKFFRTKVSDLVGINKLEKLLSMEVNKLAIIDKTYKKPPPVGVQPEASKKASRAGSKAKQSDNDLNQE